MIEKIYTPEEIKNNPLPDQIVALDFSDSQTSNNQIENQPRIKDQRVIHRIVSGETIASSLNTKSKKVLGEFTFTEGGSIRIGEYTPGVSGDLRLTPNGLTARDSSGITTFSIDGTTGDGVFKGQVLADDFVISDGDGLVSLSNFTSVTSINRSLGQTITTHDTDTDITGSSLEFSLARPSVVLISISVSGWIAYNSDNDQGTAYIFMELDDVQTSTEALFSGGGWGAAQTEMTGSIVHFAVLAAGTHTIKLVGNLQIDVDTPVFYVNTFGINYAVLGK